MNAENQPHPSTMTDEEKAALIASDPSAFDEDDAPSRSLEADTNDAGDDAGAKTDTGETVAAGDAGDDDSADMIPKARFNEMLGRAKDAEAKLAAQEAAAAAAAAEPTRNVAEEFAAAEAVYDARNAELLEQYEATDISFTEFHAEQAKALKAYNATNRELSKLEAVQTARQEQARIESEKANQSWQTTVTAWREANAEFLGNAIRYNAVAALIDEIGKDGSLSDTELLAKVEAQAYEAFNWQGARTETGKQAQATPHATRNATDARAASSASAQPGQITGGVGARGAPTGKIDLSTLKPGEFSKQSKAEQEKLLGEGAV